jgi:glutaredoxin 3
VAKVEIYTKPMCPYCSRAKSLLRDKGVDFVEYDIAMDRNLRDEMLARANGMATVPQIFIDDCHVGGSDALLALDGAGKLDSLLAA